MKKNKVLPLKARRDSLELLDQRLLPLEEKWVICNDEQETALAIKNMVCRGAPLIGITAAYGYYLGVNKLIQNKKLVSLKQLEKIKNKLASSRPTAVNLFHALELMHETATNNLSLSKTNPLQLLMLLFQRAVDIHEKDREDCNKMSTLAADFFAKNIRKKELSILTHCNTGALACGGSGTALGIIRELHERQKVSIVYVNETRPYMQGARLTTYELTKEKIPCLLTIDSMAAVLMQRKLVDLVLVGADRISADFGVANKVGTYMLSILCKAHKVPFYVAAPESTFDPQTKSVYDIPVEIRPSSELTEYKGEPVTKGVKVLNESFDLTPAGYIDAIFTEERIVR